MKFQHAIELLQVELDYLCKMPNEFKDGIKELQQAIKILKESGGG